MPLLGVALHFTASLISSLHSPPLALPVVQFIYLPLLYHLLTEDFPFTGLQAPFVSIRQPQKRKHRQQEMRSKKSFLLFRNRQSAFFSVVVVAASLSSQSVVEGQGLFSGFGICACTPSVYDFQLDVSLECPISEALDLILEEGIESAECAIVPADSGDNEDTLPVSIHSINIEELRQDKTVAVSQSIQGDFRDGDAFRYISLSSDLEDIRGAVDLPKTLQFKISGKNVDGDEIYNTVVIEFTNDCDAYPVIQAGHTAGWIRFVSDGHEQQPYRTVLHDAFS